ncbi:hypothetical protein GOV10_02145 [Candidatus Woesearchaeota archaeon]|nr:hypothetical protein [Candidatus Woesearchaeota archaeon]
MGLIQIRMDALIKKLDSLERKYIIRKKATGAGYVPSDAYTILYALNVARELMGSPLERNGNNCDFRMCDLGAGLGRVVALAVSDKMWAYGIEENEYLAKHANKILGKLRKHIGSRGVIYHASMYTPEFMLYRDDGSPSVRLEKEEDATQVGYHVHEHPIKKHLHNYYANTDIFYSYPWAEQIPAIVDLFSFHASPGATLVMNSQLPEYLPAFADELELTLTEKQRGVKKILLLQKH